MKTIIEIRDKYTRLTDEEIVSRKNAMIRDLKDILQELANRQIDINCDSMVRPVIGKHPSNELRKP